MGIQIKKYFTILFFLTIFIGVPKTYNQLLKCKIVGNYKSKIYHLQGSRYIREMNIKGKECFSTEKEAKKKNFRKSKGK